MIQLAYSNLVFYFFLIFAKLVMLLLGLFFLLLLIYLSLPYIHLFLCPQ